jgi:hypothetical protein
MPFVNQDFSDFLENRATFPINDDQSSDAVIIPIPREELIEQGPCKIAVDEPDCSADKNSPHRIIPPAPSKA